MLETAQVPKLRSNYPVGWVILCLGALDTRYDCLVLLLALLQLSYRFYECWKYQMQLRVSCDLGAIELLDH